MGDFKDLTANDIIGYCRLDMFAVESGYENIEQLQEELAAYRALGTPVEIKARLENAAYECNIVGELYDESGEEQK